MNAAGLDDAALEKSAYRKASLRILPLIALGYGAAYIDRVNISFASMQMNRDLNLSATVYGFGAGLFFLSYAAIKGRAAAAGIALMNTIGILGGFVGPYWMGIAKDLTGNYRRGLLTMAVPMLVGAGIMLYLRWQSHQTASRIVEPAVTIA